MIEKLRTRISIQANNLSASHCPLGRAIPQETSLVSMFTELGELSVHQDGLINSSFEKLEGSKSGEIPIIGVGD